MTFKNILIGALAVAFVIGTTSIASAEVCKTPKYIAHDKGSVVASTLLVAPVTAFAVVGQAFRVFPGGAEHADRLLCVSKSMAKDVTKHLRKKY